MRRNFRRILTGWKKHPLRKPLIVRGARQVGKTFLIELFGKEEFENVISINFELFPIYQKCFDDLAPQSIIKQIELLSQQKVTAGSTLLFLDEIQQCPNALKSLRYFKEQLPELHLI